MISVPTEKGDRENENQNHNRCKNQVTCIYDLFWLFICILLCVVFDGSAGNQVGRVAAGDFKWLVLVRIVLLDWKR